MFSTEVGLGVRPATRTSTCSSRRRPARTSRAGVKPVTVWLSEDYTRAAPGGTGEAKCAGNYAASLVAQAQAAEQGCDQVVWLDAVEHRWVEEMGGMNLYFVYGSGADARIVTPALTGTLLPGITRDSLLTLAARPRLRRRGGADLAPTSGTTGNALRRDHRGVRLRHGRGDHAGRRGQVRPTASGPSATARRAR